MSALLEHISETFPNIQYLLGIILVVSLVIMVYFINILSTIVILTDKSPTPVIIIFIILTFLTIVYGDIQNKIILGIVLTWLAILLACSFTMLIAPVNKALVSEVFKKEINSKVKYLKINLKELKKDKTKYKEYRKFRKERLK